MATIDYPHRAVVEMMFDGVWTDVGGASIPGTTDHRLLARPIPIKRGRADSSSRLQPASAHMVFDNRDGALTPNRAMSPWWPHIDLGTQVRVSTFGGSPHLALTGTFASRAGTPDDPDLDITGDWTIAVELLPPIALPPSGSLAYEITGKFNASSGDERSVVLRVEADGVLGWRWSTDGTAGGEQDRLSTAAIPRPDTGPLTVAAWLDVDDGAGGHTVTFYAHRGDLAGLLADPDAAILGNPVTAAGTTSVHSGTAPLDVGDVTGSGFSPYPGAVRRLRVLAGPPSSMDVRADPDFAAATPGDTSLVDSTGKTWTIQGDAALSNLQTRFTGQIADIRPTWPEGDITGGAGGPGLSRVAITAAGVTRRLTQGAKPLDSALKRMIAAPINADQVKAAWPCEDGRNSTQAASAVPGGRPMHVGGEVQFASDDTLVAAKPLMHVRAGDPAGWSGLIPAAPAGDWAIEMFVRMTTPEPSGETVLAVVRESGGRVRSWRLSVQETQIALVGQDADDSVVVLAAIGHLNSPLFDAWTIFRLDVRQDGGNIDWRVRWVPIVGVGADNVAYGDEGTVSGTVGRPESVGTLLVGPPEDGISVGHIVVTAPSRVLGWLAGADAAFAAEPAAERAQRLCDEESVPIEIIGDTADSTLMGPQRPLPLVDLLTECADAEQGVLGEMRHRLGFTFRTRASMENQAPALTLTAANRALVNPFEPTADDQRLRNDVTAERIDGGSARVVDDESVARHGTYDESAPANVWSDLQLADHAGWRLHRGTWREMRYPMVAADLTVADQADPTIVDAWLGTIEGDVVQVDDLPAEHPTDMVRQIIEGSAETIDPDRWTLELTGSPAGPWEVGIRADPQRGKRDTSGSVLDADYVAGTDTTMDVETTLGPLWTTDPGEFPFELDVGGARINVTAIGAALGQVQTFTVDQQPLNGVTKTVPAGSPVHLWRPTVRSL